MQLTREALPFASGLGSILRGPNSILRSARSICCGTGTNLLEHVCQARIGVREAPLDLLGAMVPVKVWSLSDDVWSASAAP